MDPGVAVRRHGAGLLMMVVNALQPLLMAQPVIQMHGSAAGYGKHMADPLLHQLSRNIIRYLDSHPSPPLTIMR